MANAQTLVEVTTVNTTHKLLTHLHMQNVTLLLVALWQIIHDAYLAVLASVSSVGAKTAAATSSAKATLVLLKHSSTGPGQVTAWWSWSSSTNTTVKQLSVTTGQLQLSAVPGSQLAVAGPNAVGLIANSPSPYRAQQQQQQQGYLLPPQLPQHNGKLTVVLDLDETLLCTYKLSKGADGETLQLAPANSSSAAGSSPIEAGGSLRNLRMRRSSLLPRSGYGGAADCRGSSNGGSYTVTASTSYTGELGHLGVGCRASCWVRYCPADASSGQQVTTLAVFERPGCRQFLQEVSSFAEVVLFTAASACYAEPLVDLLDPERRLFRARLFHDATVRCCGREGVKDLSGFGRDLCRTVLVDNSPYSFMLQPANGLPCMPYHGQAQDNQLPQVILPLLQSLAQVGDIRPLLDSKFRVREWLHSKGYDAAA